MCAVMKDERIGEKMTNILIVLHEAMLLIKVAVIGSQCTTSISSKFCTIGAVCHGRNFIGFLNPFFSFPRGFPPTSCKFSCCGDGS